MLQAVRLLQATATGPILLSERDIAKTYLDQIVYDTLAKYWEAVSETKGALESEPLKDVVWDYWRIKPFNLTSSSPSTASTSGGLNSLNITRSGGK